MSITVNLRYKGENGSAKKFVDEMISSGTVKAIRNESRNTGGATESCVYYEYLRIRI